MSNSLDEFDQIIQSNYPKGTPKIMVTDNMPAITPGEGGVFGLAALLIGAGLTQDFTEHVQLAVIAGGTLLGIVGGVVHGRIRVARNETVAVKAAADAELLAYAHADDGDDD